MKLLGPRILLHGEGLAVLICCCVLYGYWDYGWMWFALLFFAPDLSMLGYLWKLRVGAACYNAIHTYLAPLALYLVLYGSQRVEFAWLCLIWGAHIGLDRVLGYGLKFDTAFRDTHLQKL